MKKTLKILLDDKKYVIKMTEEKKVIVSDEDLILNAKEVFDNFFSDVEIGKKLDLVVTIDESVKGSHELHISNEIKKILEDIQKRINDKCVDVEESK